MRRAILSSLLVAGAHAHGVILMTKGANGINAPGSCVLDGTPRDCIVNSCGAQADTGIIRDAEIDRGQYGPLGWTQGGGNCKPDAVISQYMGLGTAPKYTGGRTFTGKPDPFEEEGKKAARRAAHDAHLDALFSKRADGPNFNPLALPLVGFLGLGGNRTSYNQENIVADYAGYGKDHGLPTTDDDNTISCLYRQVNEDGPGPMSAAVDATSAATDRKAFVDAKVLQNVPGDGFVGLSLATNTNFPVRVQLPKDTVCAGKVAGLDNVCFVRLRNNAFAGPFGGAGFFTQSDKAKKRALEYRRRKRAEAGDME